MTLAQRAIWCCVFGGLLAACGGSSTSDPSEPTTMESTDAGIDEGDLAEYQEILDDEIEAQGHLSALHYAVERCAGGWRHSSQRSRQEIHDSLSQEDKEAAFIVSLESLLTRTNYAQYRFQNRSDEVSEIHGNVLLMSGECYCEEDSQWFDDGEVDTTLNLTEFDPRRELRLVSWTGRVSKEEARKPKPRSRTTLRLRSLFDFGAGTVLVLSEQMGSHYGISPQLSDSGRCLGSRGPCKNLEYLIAVVGREGKWELLGLTAGRAGRRSLKQFCRRLVKGPKEGLLVVDDPEESCFEVIRAAPRSVEATEIGDGSPAVEESVFVHEASDRKALLASLKKSRMKIPAEGYPTCQLGQRPEKTLGAAMKKIVRYANKTALKCDAPAGAPKRKCEANLWKDKKTCEDNSWFVAILFDVENGKPVDKSVECHPAGGYAW